MTKIFRRRKVENLNIYNFHLHKLQENGFCDALNPRHTNFFSLNLENFRQQEDLYFWHLDDNKINLPLQIRYWIDLTTYTQSHY